MSKEYFSNKIKLESEERLIKCLCSWQWSYFGHEETEFRERFSKTLCVPPSIAVSSGTAALKIALRSLGVKRGDQVIVPDLTWVGTVTAVLENGATPVICGVDPLTLCLEPEEIERNITPSTRAVIVVHLYDRMCDLQAVGRICARHGVALIEDVAHCHGASRDGIQAGAGSDIACFSFQSSKLIASGEGGAVVTGDPELYDRISEVSNCGRTRDGRESEVLSDNYRMTEFQAAVANAGLTVFDDMRRIRADNYSVFRKAVERSVSLSIPERPETERWSGYRAVAHIDSDDPEVLDDVKSRFARSGLTLHPVYEFVHRSPLIPSRYKKQFIVSEFAGMAKKDKIILIDHEELLDKDFEKKIENAMLI